MIGLGNFIGYIREGSSALIGSHHQIGIIAVAAHHILRRYHLTLHKIITDIQKSLYIQHITGYTLLQPRLSASSHRSLLGNKASFGPRGHYHGIFNLLGLNQPQYLGAIILKPVRPAQASAGYLAAAQMHTLDTG